MNTQLPNAIPSEAVKPEKRNYTKGQELTEVDRDCYYNYNLDLIRTILHNGSLAGVNNPRPIIEYSSCCDEVKITRSASERLDIGIDPLDTVLILMVSNPQAEDPYHEMTTIYLSRRETHVLRSLLSRLEW